MTTARCQGPLAQTVRLHKAELRGRRERPTFDDGIIGCRCSAAPHHNHSPTSSTPCQSDACAPHLEYSLTGSSAAAVARRPTSNTLRHLRPCARVTPLRRTSSTLQHLRPCARVPPPHRNLNTCQPLQLFTRMTPVGFEPTPFRNGALSHRLRLLGQSVDDFHVASRCLALKFRCYWC